MVPGTAGDVVATVEIAVRQGIQAGALLVTDQGG